MGNYQRQQVLKEQRQLKFKLKHIYNKYIIFDILTYTGDKNEMLSRFY